MARRPLAVSVGDGRSFLSWITFGHWHKPVKLLTIYWAHTRGKFVLILKGRDSLVVPDCCAAVQQAQAIVLSYEYEDMTDAPGYTQVSMPALPVDASWQARIAHMFDTLGDPDPKGRSRFELATPRWHLKGSQAKPVACPFCSTPLPAVVRRKRKPGKLHKPKFDGDHCGTCGNRSRECECLDPACGWKPVGEPEP